MREREREEKKSEKQSFILTEIKTTTKTFHIEIKSL